MIYGVRIFEGYDREKSGESHGPARQCGQNTDLSTLDQFQYAGANCAAAFSFDDSGIVTQIQLERTGYKVNR